MLVGVKTVIALWKTLRVFCCETDRPFAYHTIQEVHLQVYIAEQNVKSNLDLHQQGNGSIAGSKISPKVILTVEERKTPKNKQTKKKLL